MAANIDVGELFVTFTYPPILKTTFEASY